MNEETARLCELARKTFTCTPTSDGHLLIRNSNGVEQTNPKAIKMGDKAYNRNTIIAYCEGREPAGRRTIKPFEVTKEQGLFFSKCTDLILHHISDKAGSDHYLIVDGIAYVAGRLYSHLRTLGKHYWMNLYADTGYVRQCAVLNGLQSFSELTTVALEAVKEWEPERLSRYKRHKANKLARNFINLLSETRRDERHHIFDSYLLVYHRATRKDKVLRKNIRRGTHGLFANMDLTTIAEAMTSAVCRLRDSVRPPKAQNRRRARVSSGFYHRCRARMQRAVKHLPFPERILMFERATLIMKDMGIRHKRTHESYGCNHILMAVNATGRMNEFLEYFEEQARSFRRPAYNVKGYKRFARNASRLWRFTRERLGNAVTWADLDIYRAIRCKTGRPLDKVSSTTIGYAIEELVQELADWRTLGSLNVSCK